MKDNEISKEVVNRSANNTAKREFTFPKSYSKKQTDLFVAINNIVEGRRIRHSASIEDDKASSFHKNLVSDK